MPINIERYPLTDSARTRQLVDDCHAQMEAHDACVLPGFLTPTAVSQALDHIRKVRAQAHQVDHYFAYDDTGVDLRAERPTHLAPGDPRAFRSHTKIRFLARDLLPADDPIHQLHVWAPMVAFVAAVMKLPRVWPSSCSLSGCVRTLAGDGELQDWHFDSNDFIVTLVLEVPAGGGAFEYVPGLRNAEREDDLAGVSHALQGTHPHLTRLSQTPGTLTLFKGRYNFHRAAPVAGAGERVIAVLSYENAPEHHSSPDWLRLFYGRTATERPEDDAHRSTV